jgi:hypothetical protein
VKTAAFDKGRISGPLAEAENWWRGILAGRRDGESRTGEVINAGRRSYDGSCFSVFLCHMVLDLTGSVDFFIGLGGINFLRPLKK